MVKATNTEGYEFVRCISCGRIQFEQKANKQNLFDIIIKCKCKKYLNISEKGINITDKNI